MNTVASMACISVTMAILPKQERKTAHIKEKKYYICPVLFACYARLKASLIIWLYLSKTATSTKTNLWKISTY